MTHRRFKTAATRGDAKARPAPDLVNRDFSAEGPDQLWVADITYMPTWTGGPDPAVVLDAWSRRIVGWAMVPRMPSDLVGHALAFGKRCREAGVIQSMGSVGDAYADAMCESFFATLQCEPLDLWRFLTTDEARREFFRFIEAFHDTRRLHSALGYESSANFEKLNHAT